MLSIEQIGRAVRRLEERMSKRKSTEKTILDTIEQISEEYITQPIVEGYVKGWFDSIKEKLVNEVALEVVLKMTEKNNHPVKVKPCPFCGSVNMQVTAESRPRVICNSCGAWSPPGDSADDAMKIWNTRKG